MATFRSQLVGAWELVSVKAYKVDDQLDVHYPMGKEAKGLIIYSSDGYMSAQQQSPGALKYTGTREVNDGTDEELAESARRYIAYSGPFYLEEKPGEAPKLWHGMTVSMIPNWIGHAQARTVRIDVEDGEKILTLSPGQPGVSGGVMRKTEIKWRKMKDNSSSSSP